MAHWITMKAADGHEFSAWRDGPEESAHCLVLAQEIFGVNGHIRYACAQFAAAGYSVIAPALLDRVERDPERAPMTVSRPAAVNDPRHRRHGVEGLHADAAAPDHQRAQK